MCGFILSVAGLVSWTTNYTDRAVRVHVVSADLRQDLAAAVLVQPAPVDDPGASSVLKDPLAAARDAGFVAAINASAFMYPLNAPAQERNTVWYAGKHVRLFGLNIADGVKRNDEHHLRQVMWFDACGRGHVGHPSTNDTPVQAVADWEGPILERGQVLSRDNPIRYQRAFAGLAAEGRRLILAVAEGGRNCGLTLAECGEFLKSQGCTEGVNFDGGGSACLMTTEEKELKPVFPADARRPVPVLLGVRRR